MIARHSVKDDERLPNLCSTSDDLTLRLVSAKKQSTSRDFLAWTRSYVAGDAVVRESSASGQPGDRIPSSDLIENRVYFFDAEAVAGICHAIEDLALEEADGVVRAVFENFRHFEAHRECYLHLAATIEQVQVSADGKPPRPVRHLNFKGDERAKHFRAVVYEGRSRQAAFVAEHSRQRDQYLGFYTLDSGLIKRLSRELDGRGDTFREFTRLAALDQAAKQLEDELQNQKQMLDLAIRRLQLDVRYRPGQFASELEKGLSRLSQWKTRMPEIVARAEGR